MQETPDSRAPTYDRITCVETTTPEAAHRARLAPYVEPHLARRQDGVKHPVHDFLFTYYSFSPAKLMTWEPGWPDSGTAEQLERLRPLARGIRTLLVATASRPCTRAASGCTSGRWCTARPRPGTPCPAPRLRRHGRGGRVAPDRLLALRRVPLLHALGAPAQHALPRPRRPGRVRAAGLPARDDGPLQARVPALAARRLGPRRRLLRARLGRPRGRHARVAVRLLVPRPRADPHRDARGEARVRRVAAGVRRAGRAPARAAGRRVRWTAPHELARSTTSTSGSRSPPPRCRSGRGCSRPAAGRWTSRRRRAGRGSTPTAPTRSWSAPPTSSTSATTGCGPASTTWPSRSRTVATLDALRADAAAHGWSELFGEKYPHAGGDDHTALYLENSESFEVEVVAGD